MTASKDDRLSLINEVNEMENRMNRFGPKKGISNSVSALSGYNNRTGLGHGVMSREQFLKGAGFVTAAIAASGLGLSGVARAVGPTTYYVSPTGSDTTGDGSYGNPFRQIQPAVQVAQAGDSIEVAGGTYVGAVVNKSVTITGSTDPANPSIIGVDMANPSLLPGVFAGAPYATSPDSRYSINDRNGFFIPATFSPGTWVIGAKISNFTIRCQTLPASGTMRNGVTGFISKNIEISNMTIINPNVGIINNGGQGWHIHHNKINGLYPIPTSYGATGIQIGSSGVTGTQEVRDNIIEYNEIDVLVAIAGNVTGILFRFAGATYPSITNNYVQNNKSRIKATSISGVGLTTGIAINATNVPQTKFMGNFISNNWLEGGSIGLGAGIIGINIGANTFDGNTFAGDSTYKMLLWNSDGEIITNNVFSGTAQYGLCTGAYLGNPAMKYNKNIKFAGNDLSGLTTSLAQVYLNADATTNYFGSWTDPVTLQEYPNNTYGSLKLTYNTTTQALQTLGVFVVYGNLNTINLDDFTQCKLYNPNPPVGNGSLVGYVPGWNTDILYPGMQQIGHLGCIAVYGNGVDKGVGNIIYEHPRLGVKYFPPGTDLCGQVMEAVPGSNMIYQWDKLCMSGGLPSDKFSEIIQRLEYHAQFMAENEPPYGQVEGWPLEEQ